MKLLLKRAVAIVEKNMDNIEFSTDEFAREMNMSRSNLHLKLKAITGESTIDFIRKIRFNEAAKLLKDYCYTIAEVSTMVGFNTPSYFATSFKKYFGCLPTEYIKKAKRISNQQSKSKNIMFFTEYNPQNHDIFGFEEKALNFVLLINPEATFTVITPG